MRHAPPRSPALAALVRLHVGIVGTLSASLCACGGDDNVAAETGSTADSGTSEPPAPEPASSDSRGADSTGDATSGSTFAADDATTGDAEAGTSSSDSSDSSGSSDSSDSSSSDGGTDTGGEPGDGVLDFETSHVHSTFVSESNGSIALADFDADGTPDVALFDINGNTINVVMNDGLGGFAPPIENAVGDDGRITAGDVDEDGFADVVMLGTGQVHVFSGLGDGTFTAPLSSPISLTYSPILRDLDGDGHLDLVGRSLSNVSVSMGDGTGVFTPIGSHGFGSTPALAILDIDGDGADDLAAYDGSSVLVRLGDGTGSFGGQTANPLTTLDGVPLGAGTRSVFSIGDIDGDGYGDAATDDSAGVTILLGDADGSLTQSVRFAGRFKAVTHFDDDGQEDLLIQAINNSGRSMLRFGLGDGTFGAPVQYSLGVEPGPGVPTDIDLDGFADVVFALFATTVFGADDGMLQLPRVSLPPSTPREIASGDFDGNAYPDIVVTLEDASSVATLLGQPDGRFVLGEEVVLPLVAESIAAGDVDEDGHDDVLWGRPQGQAGILLGDGAGGLDAGAAVSGGMPVLLVDVDGDQHLDAITSFDTQLRASLGDGTGAFASAITSPDDGNLQSMVAFDANGDSIVDLATASWDSAAVSVLLGDGAGAFTMSHTIALVNGGLAVDHGDFDGDGSEDLVYIVYTNPVGVGVALGLGDGTFGTPTMMGPNVGSPTVEIAVGDFNGDTIPDIAVTTVLSYVDVLVGAGDGTFSAIRRQPMQGVRQFVAADQDLDGLLDIVACHSVGSPPGFVSTMRNATH